MPDGNYAEFIEETIEKRIPEGNFVLLDGTVVGRHKGITRLYSWTEEGTWSVAWTSCFCLGDSARRTNEVVIGSNPEESLTYTLRANQLNFMSIEDLKEGEKIRVFAKIRYNHKGAGRSGMY